MDLESYGASPRRVVPSLAVGTRRERRRRAGNQPYRGMPLFGVRRRTVGLAGPREGDGSRERKAEFSWAGGLPLRAGKSAMASYGHHRSRKMMINSGAGPVPTRTHGLTSALLPSRVKQTLARPTFSKDSRCDG